MSSRNECLTCEELHINPAMIVGLVVIVLVLAVTVYCIFFLPEDWSSVFAPIKVLANDLIRKRTLNRAEPQSIQDVQYDNSDISLVQTSLSPLAESTSIDKDNTSQSRSRLSMSNAAVLDSQESERFNGKLKYYDLCGF